MWFYIQSSVHITYKCACQRATQLMQEIVNILPMSICNITSLIPNGKYSINSSHLESEMSWAFIWLTTFISCLTEQAAKEWTIQLTCIPVHPIRSKTMLKFSTIITSNGQTMIEMKMTAFYSEWEWFNQKLCIEAWKCKENLWHSLKSILFYFHLRNCYELELNSTAFMFC